jgi:hypothetical protein
MQATKRLTFHMLLLINGCMSSVYAQKLPPTVQPSKYCTLLGCLSEAVIEVRRKDDVVPDYKITVEFDDKSISCEPSPQEIYAPEMANCGANVLARLREVAHCAQPDFPCHLGGPNGQIEEHIAIIGTSPKLIKITLSKGDKTVAAKSFSPEYASQFPNGKDCPDECKNWRVAWLLN